jgi:hypothetical protein
MLDSAGEAVMSLRGSFWQKAFAATPPTPPWMAELSRPEDYPEWWAFSGYSDLLEFERDACHLARGTILFAESPGSLAELGALAVDNTLVKSLLVVVQEQHINEQSFLKLGPLRRVEHHNGLCVVGSLPKNELSDVDFQSIVEHVEGWLPSIPRVQHLASKNPTHVLLLLADLVDLLVVTKESELLEAMTHFGLQIDNANLIRSLQLLRFFGLIRIAQRGNEKFYVHLQKSGAPWIDYKGISERFDRSRFKVTCMQFVEQDRRRKAIMEVSQ